MVKEIDLSADRKDRQRQCHCQEKKRHQRRGSSRPVGEAAAISSAAQPRQLKARSETSLLKLILPIIVIGIMIYISTKFGGGGSGITSPSPGSSNGGFNVVDNSGTSSRC
jgi:hypothetical protein